MFKNLFVIIVLLFCINQYSFSSEGVIDDEDLELEGDFYNKETVNFNDPLEKLNRKIYAFNKIFNRFVIMPPAKIYDVLLPKYAKDRTEQFIDNLKEPLTLVQGLATADLNLSFKAFFRFFINSTIGLFGIFDVASLYGLKNEKTSFGQVFQEYGMKKGAFLILPVLGPSNVRDSFGTILDIALDPLPFLVNNKYRKRVRLYRYGGDSVVTYAKFENYNNMLSDVSLDEYIALRGFYYQKCDKQK